MYKHKLVSTIRRTGRVSVSCLLILTALLVSGVPVASAIRTNDLRSVTNNLPFYDPTASTDLCPSDNAAPSTTNYVVGKDKTAIAQIIIGIAKTEGLGQRGALLGLMAGLDESHFTIYANSKVPVSLLNPAKQAIGHDGHSVGVFQQQPQFTWSTIATGPAALDNKDAVWQLMDPAYSAEAFFGSPPGSNAPPALSKGVQNKKDWQTLDPWVVVQKVQGSGTPDGSNYKAFVAPAQSLVDKLWDSSPPVPLPVPIGKGAPAAAATATTTNSSVYILGDSLSVGMESPGGLKDLLSKHSWQATINAEVGRTFSQGEAQVTKDADAIKNSSTIVIELGTNNYGATPASFNASLKSLYDAVRAVNSTATIYWMNYTASKEPWQSKLVEKTQLLATFASQNNIKIIDWAGSSAAKYTADDSSMGIHPGSHYADLAYIVYLALGQAGSATGQVNCTTGASPGASVGIGKGKFVDNTTITFKGVSDMMARVQQLIDPTSKYFLDNCNHHDSQTGALIYCAGWCDHAAALAWGRLHSGYESAWDHWNALANTSQGHPGDRNVPVGALLFYGNKYPGHVAVYLGNNKVMSTDVLNDKYNRVGGIYIANASDIETTGWHMNYLGWTTPFGQ